MSVQDVQPKSVHDVTYLARDRSVGPAHSWPLNLQSFPIANESLKSLVVHPANWKRKFCPATWLLWTRLVLRSC